MSELSCGTRFIGRNETLDQILNPNRNRAKKSRKHDTSTCRPAHPRRDAAPVDHVVHVAPTSASEDERSSSRSLLPIDYNPD